MGVAFAWATGVVVDCKDQGVCTFVGAETLVRCMRCKCVSRALRSEIRNSTTARPVDWVAC